MTAWVGGLMRPSQDEFTRLRCCGTKSLASGARWEMDWRPLGSWHEWPQSAFLRRRGRALRQLTLPSGGHRLWVGREPDREISLGWLWWRQRAIVFHKSCLTRGTCDGKCTEEMIPVGDAWRGSMWVVWVVEGGAAF